MLVGPRDFNLRGRAAPVNICVVDVEPVCCVNRCAAPAKAITETNTPN
jgi:hypothetical protein